MIRLATQIPQFVALPLDVFRGFAAATTMPTSYEKIYTALRHGCEWITVYMIPDLRHTVVVWGLEGALTYMVRQDVFGIIEYPRLGLRNPPRRVTSDSGFSRGLVLEFRGAEDSFPFIKPSFRRLSNFSCGVCTFDVKWNPIVSITESAASNTDSRNDRQDVSSQILLVHRSWERAPLSVDIGSSRCNPRSAGSNERSYLAGSNDDSKSQLRTSIDAQPLIAIKVSLIPTTP
ncbi:uncharacterized protein HD556DRAFT_1309384 [Suillus plorans]|uniref:Uncharacterized protein n=1 Tax=Suillus plorans TaxID=116603 RepID=A0A9P7ANU6_9AGAM|nr:uncharacterized protein HD556DRAFT_1309384 [Suillus plorans]KAG1792312.1 hypothetical protein HD556DRAFT_1309384 [Suillus plorans]